MSKFFNRNWKAGFTLVELIVVIAILAILAGIAIPVYSGYIKKANEAADNQLLAAVNTAFGAACVQENVDFYALQNGASSLVIDDGRITGIGSLNALSGTALQSFKDGFATYYSGNDSTQLKYFKDGDIAFYAGEGFKGGGSLRSTSFTTSGGQTVTLTAPQDVIDKINESIWTNSDELGVDNLLGSVDEVTGIVAGLFNNANVRASLTPVLTSDEFVAYALQALDGGDGAMAQQFQAMVQQSMVNDPTLTEEQAKSQLVKQLVPMLMTSSNNIDKKLLSNAMVLYTAANSGSLVANGWYDTFKNDGGKVNTDKVLSVLDGTPADAQTFAELSAAFAMNMAYDAYAADTGEGAMSKTEYLNSAKGQEAFDAYLSTLSLITDNCNNADMTSEVLFNGFGGDALLEALESLLGNN